MNLWTDVKAVSPAAVWGDSAGGEIIVAEVYQDLVLIAKGGGELVILNASGTAFEVIV